ncbi:hypothetical protein KIPB_007769, partial [Kipferlia bialata]|eukprot:g7769.t1
MAGKVAKAQGKKKKKALKNKYSADDAALLKGVQDKVLRNKLKHVITENQEQTKEKELVAALRSERGGMATEGDERTYHIHQKDVLKQADAQTRRNAYQLNLGLGPYTVRYDRSGRLMMLAGKKGHVSVVDRMSGNKLVTELQLGETIRDACFIGAGMTAVAQKKNIYIYDVDGTELHMLGKANDARFLQYLPYHWMLCYAGHTGTITWQDTSMGTITAQTPTKQGSVSALRQNPWNAVLCAGHAEGGRVTMWSPATPKPLVSMVVGRGSVQALAVNRGGDRMVTATGLTSVVYANQTHIWPAELFTKGFTNRDSGEMVHGKKATKIHTYRPYMREFAGSSGSRGPTLSMVSARFCPAEDILGIGLDGGMRSILVPGACNPELDTLEGVDPFMS